MILCEVRTLVDEVVSTVLRRSGGLGDFHSWRGVCESTLLALMLSSPLAALLILRRPKAAFDALLGFCLLMIGQSVGRCSVLLQDVSVTALHSLIMECCLTAKGPLVLFGVRLCVDV